MMTTRPSRDTAQLFQEVAASMSSELDGLRAEHLVIKVNLAAANEREVALRTRLESVRRLQVFTSAINMIGAVLIGFGVNYLTDENATIRLLTGGWIMLGVGVTIQLATLIAPFIHRDDSSHQSTP
ncbi:hypothetical protein [Tessaracoccus caeni]|uniref:hypothetical protein n=1 Tax=Tessaracoccus caeni TaxID=3031239 RepID=UPI0023DB8DC3|nr:hypothetical protein [Tessaracoccus caeni]MDF1489421.1 hypothetical protein [Tessaracoccus caeni]